VGDPRGTRQASWARTDRRTRAVPDAVYGVRLSSQPQAIGAMPTCHLAAQLVACRHVEALRFASKSRKRLADFWRVCCYRRNEPKEGGMRRIGLVMIAVTLVATGCSSRAPKRTMATAPLVNAPPVSSDRLDVSGKWAGKWIGYGIVDIPRNEDATAELYQRGSDGDARLVLERTDAAGGG